MKKDYFSQNVELDTILHHSNFSIFFYHDRIIVMGRQENLKIYRFFLSYEFFLILWYKSIIIVFAFFCFEFLTVARSFVRAIIDILYISP